MLKGKYKERTTIVNNTFNVGCSGFIKRFDASEKPIKVAHFHPTNRIAWDTHARGRNGEEYITVYGKFKDLCIEYYGDIIKSFKYEDKNSPLEIRDIAMEKK